MCQQIEFIYLILGYRLDRVIFFVTIILFIIISEEIPIYAVNNFTNLFGKLEPIYGILGISMRLNLVRTTLTAVYQILAFLLASFKLILHLTP